MIMGLGGNDTILAPSVEANTKPRYLARVCGGAGNDVIRGAARADGGSGDDQLFVTGRLHGGTGDDLLRGGTKLFGEAGDDDLMGSDSRDFYSPGSGNDVVRGVANPYNPDRHPPEPKDVLDLSRAPEGVTVNLERENLSGWGFDRITDINYVSGSPHADTLIGLDHATETLVGNGGADRLFGLGGGDCLIGGIGADRIRAGSGSDQVPHSPGDDDVKGGPGSDYLDFRGQRPVRVDLKRGVARGRGTDRVADFEEVWGSDRDDVLMGGPAAEQLSGGGGSDRVVGRGGNDRFAADDGGRDVYVGGAGVDLLDYAFASDGVTADLARGTANDDQISGIEGVIGSEIYNDRLVGNERANVFYGSSGKDSIDGRGGGDKIYGGGSTDRISGGHGDDVIVGDCFRPSEYDIDCWVSVDRIRAGPGRDLVFGDCFRFRPWRAGDCHEGEKDLLWGGSGLDRVSYRGATRPVLVDLFLGRAFGQGRDRLFSFERAAPYSSLLRGDGRRAWSRQQFPSRV